IADGFQLEPLVRIERRQVVEEDLVAGFLGRLEIDSVDFNQREVTLAFLRRTNLPRTRFSRAQIEAADLRRRDVNVVRPGQIVVFRSAQESEPVREAFKNTLRKDQAALLGLRLQNLENKLLLAKTGGVQNAHVLRHLIQVLDAHVLELDKVESRSRTRFPLLLLSPLLSGMALRTLVLLMAPALLRRTVLLLR